MKWNTRRQGVTVASVLVLCFTSALSRAQDPDSVLRNTLVLPELVQEALARNPEIVAARKQWDAATNRITQARSMDDPTLSVQWWNAPESFNLGRAENTLIGLSQKFPFPGKLALKEQVASRSADMTEQAVRAKERDLIARLKQTYYDLFLAHKAIQIHHEQIDLLKQFFEITNAKFRAGKGSQVDVLKAQVELSTLHQQLPVLEQRRDTAQGKLNMLLDRDPRFPLAPPQEPREGRFDQDLEDLYHAATTARPELKAADLAIQRNEQSRALALREYYPDINVGVQRFQNFQAPNGFGAVVSINLPFAFWTKPKYDAGVQEAAAAVAAARAEHRTLENLTRFQIRDLLAKVRASWEVAVLYRTTVLPQAEQGVEAARAGYRTGRTGFLDLIEADRAWRGFQLEYYRALVEREHRLAELEQVIGADLNGNS
ncbi:TolC family protein [Nitrospira lenta]|uniref:Putative Similar to heavy metal efflux pump protein CzcC n=1 Tax=Nitrospira lenta TaxID=1436998 RepID=A0A330LBK2_9BACT|nr:TolC family protein [Nitrospira lenta]SPP66297.1 putative Similar to heavy metal efflux pump protein CzcC [Nitrospira lenta]